MYVVGISMADIDEGIEVILAHAGFTYTGGDLYYYVRGHAVPPPAYAHMIATHQAEVLLRIAEALEKIAGK